jgi:hypothetical protein
MDSHRSWDSPSAASDGSATAIPADGGTGLAVVAFRSRTRWCSCLSVAHDAQTIVSGPSPAARAAPAKEQAASKALP